MGILTENLICLIDDQSVFSDELNITDGPSLSLDINQSAANPAALAMAILNSTKPSPRTRSSPQVPLVIISQPLPAPITGQTSSGSQVVQEAPDQPPGLGLVETEVVSESIQISDGSPDLIQSSSHSTPLPVVNNQPTSELTGVSVSNTPPTREEEPAVDVSLTINTDQHRSIRTNTDHVV